MIPKTWQCAGVQVQIQQSWDIAEHGRCEYDKRKIWLNANNDTLIQWRTMFHELAHFSITAQALKPDEMDEEAICNWAEGFVAEILNQVCKCQEKP